MADNVVLGAAVGTGATISTDDLGAGVEVQRVKVQFGADGSATDTSAANPLPVVQTGTPGLPTGAAIASKQPALGTAGTASADVITVQGIASMTAVKVDGSAVTQPVSGTVTASGPLTDTQLRASAVPVSGTVTASGPLTDTQLRASAVPVSLASAPSTAVTNAGTFAVQDSEKVADNAGFTDGTTKVDPVGFIFDEVAGTALTENDIGAGRMDSKRAQVLTLEDATTRGQRAAISAAGRLSVDASGVAVPITDNSGSLTVDAPVGTPAFVRLSDGAAAITTLATSLASLPALATGSNLVGRVNIEPETTGGLSIFHLVSAATTNATNVKASAGQVYGWYVYNSNAAARKLVFHNASGTPTAGASVSFAIVIPPTSAANVEFTTGIAFATGIAITTVTDLTDAGATAVAASDLIINIFYK